MPFQVRRCLLHAALIACSGAAMAAQSAAAPAAGESRLQQQDGAAIRSLLVAAAQGTAERGNAYRLRELAERFYAESGFVPAWFEGNTPGKQALQVLALLQGAASHGLDPADYDAARLAERLRGAGGTRGAAPAEAASIDVALTLSLFRWLSDLHLGRASPRALRVLIDLPQERLDLVKAVREAIAYEEAFHAKVEDVHTPALAVAHGLQPTPGYDLRSWRPDGEERRIEVKGRAQNSGSVELTDNEWIAACNGQDTYWLYAVYGCATSTRTLWRVQDPWRKRLGLPKGGVLIDKQDIVEAAET